MLTLNSFLLYSEEPKKLVDFYRQVLARDPDWEEEGFSGFELGCSTLIIGLHSKVHGQSTSPERMIFNLETEDVPGEFARMKGLGAKVIADPYSLDHHMIGTLADPDGNYFQVVSPMEA